MYVQQLSRTVHTANSGMEIVRTLYVEPYSSYPAVLDVLQGSVGDDGRVLPSHDPYVPICYCNECIVEQAHEDAMASSADMADRGDLISDQLKTQEAPAPGTAGAIITAHYRPLVSAFPEGTGVWTDPESNVDYDNPAFDWLDPTFQIGFREMPWPIGLLHANPVAGGIWTLKDEISQPFAVTIVDFSLRRILVKSPPYTMLSVSANKLNSVDFPPANHPAAQNLPRFYARTLKFVGADIEPMMDSKGNRWWELAYRFKWIVAYTAKQYDINGNESRGWVTWNHVLMKPNLSPVAWYEIYRNGTTAGQVQIANIIPGQNITAGRLHSEIDFMGLFR